MLTTALLLWASFMSVSTVLAQGVGIGTNNPAPGKKLDVAGDVLIEGTAQIGTVNPFTLPAADGPSGYVIKTNGAGLTVFSPDNNSGGTITSISVTAPLTGGTITTTGTIGIGQATTSTSGYLNSTDWNTFNNKVGGSGSTNYIPKWTGSSALGNSQVYDNGTNVGIGTTSPSATLTVVSPNLAANGTTMRLSPVGGGTSTTSRWSMVDFWSTFDNYAADQGPRRTASIKAGYSGGVWGNEYLSFHVANATDAATEPTERFRINANGAFAINGASNTGGVGQVLQSNGAGSPPTWAALTSGSLNGIRVFTSGSGTYVPSANTKSIWVIMVGGGGAGGGANYTSCSGSYFIGGGGGAGGYCEGYVPGPTSLPYSVGTGGTGNSNCGSAGGSGTATTFSTFSAGGGAGGASASQSSGSNVVVTATGGIGGVALGAAFNVNGQPGENGYEVSGNYYVSSGDGGGTKFGSGGAGSTWFAYNYTLARSGTSATMYGAGGGGAIAAAGGSAVGGNGAGGIIIVYEYK
jgi:hypothetical protein